MRYLVDACIVILYASDKERLTKNTLDILDNPQGPIYVSSITATELVLLRQCGKLRETRWKSAEDIVDYIVNELGFEIKPIDEEHVRTLANLPMFDDHKDPFDRMLIAHAITENITLISCDTKFPRYVKYGLEFIFNDR